MTAAVAVEQGRVEGVAECVSRGGVWVVEAVGEAGNVGEHGGGAATAAAERAWRAVDVRIH